jgi:hypothetical protein
MYQNYIIYFFVNIYINVQKNNVLMVKRTTNILQKENNVSLVALEMEAVSL